MKSQIPNNKTIDIVNSEIPTRAVDITHHDLTSRRKVGCRQCRTAELERDRPARKVEFIDRGRIGRCRTDP